MGYWFIKAVLAPVLRVFFRPTAFGLANVPAEGGAILAGNHNSFLDNFMIPLLVPRRVTYLAKSDYFTGTGVKGRLQALFFRSAGQIPIDRSGGAASEAALRTGLRVLQEGGLLALYPEGTRSPDGRLYRGKTGVARMALEAGVPVVPVGLRGMFDVQPPGTTVPKPKPVSLTFGRPLDFSRYEGMEGDRFVLRSITDEIMYELMLLSGQEYVDTYATKAKADLEDARSLTRETRASDAPRPVRRAS